jgi:hypothetical protein
VHEEVVEGEGEGEEEEQDKRAPLSCEQVRRVRHSR